MTNDEFPKSVFCPTAEQLFDDFSDAVEVHSAATKKLISLGEQRAFAEALKVAEEKRLKSRAARDALEQHLRNHGCNVFDWNRQGHGLAHAS